MQISDKVSSLSKGAYKFNKLSQKHKIIAEYIWIGGNGLDIRSKSMTLNAEKIVDITDLPDWNYDGSSTNQAAGHDSEVLLKPRAYFPDPFRLGHNVIVLCDTWRPDGTPTNTSFRDACVKIMDLCVDEEPWFGYEQEYVLFRTDVYPHWPLGFPEGGYSAPQGPYYCGVGSDVCYGRQIMEAHLKCCLYAELKISGANAEVLPGQWEYQIGPSKGIELGDHMWVSRYLLLRVAEHFGVAVNWDPKPVAGPWNGSGCHANYSTNSTRNVGGLEVINKYIEKLREKHIYFIDIAGMGNEKRLSGNYETSNINLFSSGVANRGASIRIPRFTARDGKGYLEDRRPASNCDPYVISAMQADITILDGMHSQSLHDRYVAFVNSTKI